MSYLRCNDFKSVLKISATGRMKEKSAKSNAPTLSFRPERREVEKSLQKLCCRPNNWFPTAYIEGIPRLADFVSIARNDRVDTFIWGKEILRPAQDPEINDLSWQGLGFKVWERRIVCAFAKLSESERKVCRRRSMPSERSRRVKENAK
jgi:hypothetical protein